MRLFSKGFEIHMTNKKAVKLSFEERLQEAGQIADSLSGNQLTLDESMHAYERGMTILNQLEEELRNMQRRISQIDMDSKEITDFEEVNHDEL